jgi:hypothetical protein
MKVATAEIPVAPAIVVRRPEFQKLVGRNWIAPLGPDSLEARRQFLLAVRTLHFVSSRAGGE